MQPAAELAAARCFPAVSGPFLTAAESHLSAAAAARAASGRAAGATSCCAMGRPRGRRSTRADSGASDSALGPARRLQSSPCRGTGSCRWRPPAEGYRSPAPGAGGLRCIPHTHSWDVSSMQTPAARGPRVSGVAMFTVTVTLHSRPRPRPSVSTDRRIRYDADTAHRLYDAAVCRIQLAETIPYGAVLAECQSSPQQAAVTHTGSGIMHTCIS